MLQLISFNTGGARWLHEPPYRPNTVGKDVAEALKTVIDPAKPTVIALQETGAVEKYDVLYESALEALVQYIDIGYRSAYAREVDMLEHFHHRLWSREAYNGADFATEGNGIVTNLRPAKWPWKRHFTDAEPWYTQTQISWASLYSTGSRDSQPRNAMDASLTHPDYGPLFIINTHLGTLSGEDRHDATTERSQAGVAMRRYQVGEILRITHELRAAEETAEQDPRPIILTGDFNAVPGSAPMNDLGKIYTLLAPENPIEERYTHLKHNILIDHVLISDPCKALPTGTVRLLPIDGLSDHRPVLAAWS